MASRQPARAAGIAPQAAIRDRRASRAAPRTTTQQIYMDVDDAARRDPSLTGANGMLMAPWL